jgi:hypothetical protein
MLCLPSTWSQVSARAKNMKFCEETVSFSAFRSFRYRNNKLIMIQFSKPFLCIICTNTNSAYTKFVTYVKVSHRHHLCKCRRIKLFRTEFVSVISLHTKFNMTMCHVSLLTSITKRKLYPSSERSPYCFSPQRGEGGGESSFNGREVPLQDA